MDRRAFLRNGIISVAGVTAWQSFNPLWQLARADEARPAVRYEKETDSAFPYLEVAGTPHEIGLAIGSWFGGGINQALKAREKWFKPLKDFATGDGKSTVEAMMAAACKHTPAVVEELQGWAKGSGIDYLDLFVLNSKSEIEAFIDSRCGCAGCSTVVVKDGERLLIFHNEDGHKAYENLMFVLKIKPLGAPRAVGFAYPGILEGNAPWVNEHGLVMTTNYIPGKKAVPGIPRYFLDRTAMSARSLEEALRVVSHPERAYAYHHIVASLVEKRAFSVEATPDKLVVKELDGLFFHTNHLVWDEMLKEEQFEKYMKISSHPRYESLKKNLVGVPVGKLDHDTVMTALTTHDGAPYSVCRHPADPASGATLGSAFFSAPGAAGKGGHKVRLRKNQPCKKLDTIYTV